MDDKLEELKKNLTTDMVNLLMQRNIKYDNNGIDRIKDTIKHTVERVRGIEFISVDVPIQHYINSNNLTKEDKIYLEDYMASKTIPEINVNYVWHGDVEVIRMEVLLEGDQEDDGYWIVE